MTSQGMSVGGVRPGKILVAGLGSALLLAACSTGTPATQEVESTDARSATPSPTVSDLLTTTPDPSGAASGLGTSPTPTVKETEGSVAQAKVLRVISREAWGAKPAKPGMDRHTPERLTLHHSGVVVDANDGPNSIRGHQAWHMAPERQDNQDIHYHYVIDRAGNVYEGRNTKYRGGTQTEYDPSGHFLVDLEGDMQGAQQPTKAQLASAADIFAYAAVEWDIKPATLAGHRDYAKTTCPGDNLYSRVTDGSLQAQIDERLDAGGVKVKLLPLELGQQRVNQILNS